MRQDIRARLSVIVLSFNGMQHLPECLASIQRQISDLDEFIVVDNGSRDGSAEYVGTHFPDARLIRLPENQGFCRGMNVGIQNASGDLILLLNQDLRLHDACLRNLVHTWHHPP
ncbi:glycosyltransferase, partial [bacterium]|nr:glycosyltransferase [candidate division CSSED10-310 bacterium]